MKAQTFQTVMTAMTESNPYGKKLSPETIALLWTALGSKVQQEVTDDMLVYAFQQHSKDPNPDKELQLHLQLFSHIYRMENEAPNFRWGLKEDLKDRMARPDVFHGQRLSPYQLGEDLHKPDLEPCLPLGQLIGLMGASVDEQA